MLVAGIAFRQRFCSFAAFWTSILLCEGLRENRVLEALLWLPFR